MPRNYNYSNEHGDNYGHRDSSRRYKKYTHRSKENNDTVVFSRHGHSKRSNEWSPEMSSSFYNRHDSINNRFFRKKKHKRISRSRSSEIRDYNDNYQRHYSPKCTGISAFTFQSSLMSELSKHQHYKEKIMKSKASREIHKNDTDVVDSIKEVLSASGHLKETTESSQPSSNIPLEEIALPPEPVASSYLQNKTPKHSPKLAKVFQNESLNTLIENKKIHTKHSNEQTKLDVDFTVV